MVSISNLIDTKSNFKVRIINLGDTCEYKKYSRFFRGKQMIKVKSKTKNTGWYRFAFDSDKEALNKAAGWSNRKDIYFLENPQLQ